MPGSVLKGLQDLSFVKIKKKKKIENDNIVEFQAFK